MVNAQDLLDKKYPNKEATEINLTELLYDKGESKLKYSEEDELVIEDFPNLTEIKIDQVGENYIEFAKVTKITIKNCPKLEKAEIHTFIDNKELVITDCPNLIELDCSHNKLKNLDLKNLDSKKINNNGSKLEILDCNNNQLETLDLSNLSDNVVDLYCQKNLLTDIKLPEKIDKLEILDLSKNKFFDLSFLKGISLIRLKTLYLDENKFSHSLENLKELAPNLKEIGIVEADINLDLSNLPNDLEKIYCDNGKLLQDNKQTSQEKKIELCKR